MAQPDQTFNLFPRLPAELRRAIWRECLPHRVWEFDIPYSRSIFYSQSPSATGGVPCELQLASRANALAPVITRVCRESRSVAFDNGERVFPGALPAGFEWSANSQASGASWLDTARDSAHLYWTANYEAEWGRGDGDIVPLRILEHRAARFSGVSSFMLDYLDHGYARNISDARIYPRLDDSGQPWISEETEQIIDILRRLPKWFVVMRVFVVHAEFKTGAGSGLFGLLGDAPIQVVDASDEARLRPLLELAQHCETGANIIDRQRFDLASADELAQELTRGLRTWRNTGDFKTNLRPAIMFRLCTSMCNHVDARRRLQEAAQASAGRGRGRGRGWGRGGGF